MWIFDRGCGARVSGSVEPESNQQRTNRQDMIRVVLLGRTGNHLFQYALGRVLARKHGVPLVLDASWFNAAGWAEVRHFLGLPHGARVRRFPSLASRVWRKVTGRHYWEFRGLPVLRESELDQSFDSKVLAAPADCVLFGYFQSPLYFESLADELRADLLRWIGESVSGRAMVPDGLADADSVAVHVRRGDYLEHRAFQVCDEGYYRRAMARMRARVPGARFFFFSDDPAWCQETFGSDKDVRVVDSGVAGANPLHDLWLMGRASHHVIANSSYSWWAAWLGQGDRQVVLMPDRWYRTREIKAPLEEKRLEGWEVVGR